MVAKPYAAMSLGRGTTGDVLGWFATHDEAAALCMEMNPNRKVWVKSHPDMARKHISLALEEFGPAKPAIQKYMRRLRSQYTKPEKRLYPAPDWLPAFKKARNIPDDVESHPEITAEYVRRYREMNRNATQLKD